MNRHAAGIVAVLAGLGLVACGGGGDDDDEEPRKPDTGYGKGAPAPNPHTCTDLCARLATCAAHLCNEDTHSTRYDTLGEVLAVQCQASCTDDVVNNQITAEQWQCLFQSSCREAIDYDTCHTQGSYYCQ